MLLLKKAESSDELSGGSANLSLWWARHRAHKRISGRLKGGAGKRIWGWFAASIVLLVNPLLLGLGEP